MNLATIVCLSILASFGNAFGVNLQKWSMNQEEAKPESQRRHPFLQPVWFLGLVPQIIKAIGDFIFVGMAPVALLAPLGALSLGFNGILAPIFHPGEKASCNTWLATGWIYVGVILTVVFAPRVDPSYDLDKLIDLLGAIPFWGFVGFCAVFVFVLHVRGYSNRRRSYGRVYYCAMAGCIGGWNIIFAKGTSELIQNAIATNDPSDWTSHPLPYFFLVGLVVSVTSCLTFLNLGLKKFEALFVVPVYLSFWNAFAITGSLIYYQEYKYMSAVDGIVYALGIAVMMVGVVLLVRERSKVVKDEDSHAVAGDGLDEEPDIEKCVDLEDGQLSVNRTEDDDELEGSSDSEVTPPDCEEEEDEEDGAASPSFELYRDEEKKEIMVEEQP
jgi:magnesium transporter